jgi:DNA repair exonuclease SbcCD nuclease subunit
VTVSVSVARPVRFLHTADWQLGLKLAFIPGDRGAWARRERFDVVERLATLAKGREVDAVVVAGDVFDDNAVGAETIQRARDALARFAPIPVLLLPGNHDAATADCVLRRLGAGAHVHPLIDHTPFALDHVVFHPCPLMRRHEREDPTRHLPARAAGDPVRVAIAHGALLDFTEGLESKNVIDWRIVLGKGFDYLALGDWHGTLSFDPRVWYSGAPEPTRFKERRPGNALVVEIDAPGATPRVEEVRVARTRWIEQEAEVADDASVDTIARFFETIAERSTTLVSLRVSGHLSITGRTRLDQLLAAEESALMHLRTDLSDLHDRPSEEDLRTLRADGFVGRAAERLREESGREETARASEDALRMLHRFLLEERARE